MVTMAPACKSLFPNTAVFHGAGISLTSQLTSAQLQASELEIYVIMNVDPRQVHNGEVNQKSFECTIENRCETTMQVMTRSC